MWCWLTFNRKATAFKAAASDALHNSTTGSCWRSARLGAQMVFKLRVELLKNSWKIAFLRETKHKIPLGVCGCYLVFSVSVDVLEVFECLDSVDVFPALLRHSFWTRLNQILHKSHSLKHMKVRCSVRVTLLHQNLGVTQTKRSVVHMRSWPYTHASSSSHDRWVSSTPCSWFLRRPRRYMSDRRSLTSENWTDPMGRWKSLPWPGEEWKTNFRNGQCFYFKHNYLRRRWLL